MRRPCDTQMNESCLYNRKAASNESSVRMVTSPSTTRPIAPTSNREIDALLGDFAWRSSILTFSVPEASSVWSTDLALGYGSPTAYGEPWRGLASIDDHEQEAFRIILAAWDRVSGVTFTETADTTSTYGTLRIAKTERPESPQEFAWAYFPSSSERGGDIWLNRTSPFASDPWVAGSSAYYAILHEVGHALGLKHPFDDTPTPTTGQHSISSTLMSYDAWPGVPHSYFDYYPTTPMRLDIAAVQYLYGTPSPATVEDMLYRFDDAQPYHQTLWDTGGIDTLVYEGMFDATLDLRPGQGSKIGQPVNAYAPESGAFLGQVSNIWMAFDTAIENATLGNGNDTIIPHETTRYLDAGAGLDTLILPGKASDYMLTRGSNAFNLSVASAPNQHATLVDIERYQLDDMSYATDLGSHQSAGQALLLLRAVAPQYLSDPAIAGNVIRALDTGLSAAGYLERLSEDGTLDWLLGDMSNQALTAYLAANITGEPANANQSANFERAEPSGTSRTELLLSAAFAPENIDYFHLPSTSWIAYPYL